MTWIFQEVGQNVHVLRMETPTSKNWEQWVLLVSDQHWDNPLCERDLLADHYNEAVARGAPILSFGDQL